MEMITMTRETLTNLEDLSSKLSMLKTMVAIAHKHVWQEVMEAENDDERHDAIFKAGALLETILEIVEARDSDIEKVILKISIA